MSTARAEQLYDSDFYAWTQAQAKELRRLARTLPNVPVDLAHIAQEIRDLGKSESEAAFSLTERIIEHLLLIEHSRPIGQGLHWSDEIDDFRDRIDRKLSPSIRRRLKRELHDMFARASRRVRRKMERYGETGCGRELAREVPVRVRASARRLAARRLTSVGAELL